MLEMTSGRVRLLELKHDAQSRPMGNLFTLFTSRGPIAGRVSAALRAYWEVGDRYDSQRFVLLVRLDDQMLVAQPKVTVCSFQASQSPGTNRSDPHWPRVLWKRLRWTLYPCMLV
jgi:hypothetical protein